LASLEPSLGQCVNINKLSNLRPISIHSHFDMVSAASVYAKPHLSQVDVSLNLHATFHGVIGKNLEIISQIVPWYENSFHIDCSVRKVK